MIRKPCIKSNPHKYSTSCTSEKSPPPPAPNLTRQPDLPSRTAFLAADPPTALHKVCRTCKPTCTSHSTSRPLHSQPPSTINEHQSQHTNFPAPHSIPPPFEPRPQCPSLHLWIPRPRCTSLAKENPAESLRYYRRILLRSRILLFGNGHGRR